MKDDAFGREPRTARHLELPTGGDVEPEAFVFDESRHREIEESLGGVEDTVAEVLPVLAGPAAEFLLVVDEQRCTEALRQLHQVAAAECAATVGTDTGRAPEKRKVERRRVSRSRRAHGPSESASEPASGSRRSIDSGAETPRRPRPDPSAIRTASASQSRAWVSSSSSVTTRHSA